MQWQNLVMFSCLLAPAVLGSPFAEFLQNHQKLNDMIGEIDESSVCMFCKFAANFVENQLTNRHHIKIMMAEFCTVAPVQFAGICQIIVSSYSDAVINQLVMKLKPNTICPELKLCHAHVKSDFELMFPEETEDRLKRNTNLDGESTVCIVCKATLGVMDNLISDKIIKEAIVDTAIELCELIMPEPISTSCTPNVTNASSLIINLMVSITPDSVCGQLDLCDSATSVAKSEWDVISIAENEI